MSEFIPGIETKPAVVWASYTQKGCEIVSIQGPDIEGGWAAIVKDKQGRIVGFSYTKDGDCVEDTSGDFNLVPARPKHLVKYVTVTLDALGMPIFSSASDVRFLEANAAVIFHKKKLVGLKVL